MRSGWLEAPLQQLTSLIRDGTHGTHEDVPTGIPLLSAKDIRNGELNIPADCRQISESDYELLHKNYQVQDDDVLLTIVGSIGRCCLVPKDVPRFTFQRSVAVVRASKVEPTYLYQYFQSSAFQQRLEDVTNASAQGGVYLGSLAKLSVSFPEYRAEQSKIAEVLSTMDRAIAQSEALIAKQQRIKTGLMQDLLTRGIDAHGQLRSEATHTFKDSPLGRIPVEWECAKLNMFVPSAEYGISSSLGADGYPVLRMNNFLDGEAELSDLKRTDISLPERLWLRNGDVLFNRTNSWDHVGRTGIWRGQIEKATFASYLVRLNAAPEKLLPEMLNIWLNWETTQIAMRRRATPAVQQVNINPTNLRLIFAAFPADLSEQETIVSRVAALNNALVDRKANLKKLQSLKTALMQDLLTGKVRVTPLLHSTEAASHG